MGNSSERASAEQPAGLITKGAQTLLVSLMLVVAAVALNLPWPLVPDARAALPFLALPLVHWHALRLPHALPAPVVLAAGLLADLVADTPFGFWPLIYLTVLASGRSLRLLLGGAGGLARSLVAVPIYAVISVIVALLAIYLYTLEWPAPAPLLAGVGLGAVLELAAALVLRTLHRHPAALPAIATGGER